MDARIRAGEPAAFMGLDGAALEALLIDPVHFLKGAGKPAGARARSRAH
jgi:hypothetical protein